MNSTCADIRDDLVAFADGELDRERAAVVSSHLERCAECESEHAALVRSWEALDHLPGIEPRPEWITEVERSIVGPRDRGRVLRFPGRAVPLVLALAATVALVAGLAWIFTREVEQEGPIAGKPAPRLFTPPKPIPTDLPQRVTPEDVPGVPREDHAPREVPVPVDTPDEGAGEVQVANLDEDLDLEGLSDEELELLDDLDVLVLMEELEELDVLENLELLDDLDPEEFDLDDA